METIDTKELRKEKIRAAKTELILDAALQILSQKGYHETRLEDIAEKAGFSKSALYRYYKDKDEIFFNIAVRERNKIIDKLETEPYRISENKHISNNLRSVVNLIFEIFGENFSFILALNSFQVIALVNALRQQATLMKIEKEFLTSESKFAEIIIRLFNNARSKGEISTPLDSEVLFEFFQGLLFSKVKVWHEQKKVGNIKKEVDEILVFLADGLGYGKQKFHV